MMRREVRIRETVLQSVGFIFSLERETKNTLKRVVMAADRFQVPSQHCPFIV